MAKKKKLKSINLGNRLEGVKNFFGNKTNQTVFGILLIFLAVFTTGAMLSYFFNWEKDQSDLQGDFLPY